MHCAVCDNCFLLQLRAWSTGQPWALRADGGSGHFLPVSVDEGGVIGIPPHPLASLMAAPVPPRMLWCGSCWDGEESEVLH